MVFIKKISASRFNVLIASVAVFSLFFCSSKNCIRNVLSICKIGLSLDLNCTSNFYPLGSCLFAVARHSFKSVKN